MVRYKMAFDRRPLLKTWAEKGTARDYIAEVVGPGYLPTAYALTPDPDSIDLASLPREYVVKATHGSGAVVVVCDQADPGSRLPADPREHTWDRIQVRPDNADPDLLGALMRHWLTQDYSFNRSDSRAPEWAYEGIQRRILVEEFLSGIGGAVAYDVKVFVFSGRAKAIDVTMNRFQGLAWRYLTPDWEVIDTSDSVGEPVARLPERPACLEELLDVAERLSTGIDFLRVDTYALGERVVVGELTSYSASGRPEEMYLGPLNAEWGRWWHPDYGPDRKGLRSGQ